MRYHRDCVGKRFIEPSELDQIKVHSTSHRKTDTEPARAAAGGAAIDWTHGRHAGRHVSDEATIICIPISRALSKLKPGGLWQSGGVGVGRRRRRRARLTLGKELEWLARVISALCAFSNTLSFRA
jgi:hypothetical protein